MKMKNEIVFFVTLFKDKELKGESSAITYEHRGILNLVFVVYPRQYMKLVFNIHCNLIVIRITYS